MSSRFTRIGALEALGGLVFFVRTKVGALVLGPVGVGVVSVVDQFLQLVLQLSALAIPFAAVKVLSKAHSESTDAFKAAYAGLLRLLLILGSLGAALGICVVALIPSWASSELAAYATFAVVGLLGLPAMILHGFFRNVPASAMQPETSAVWDVIAAAIMTGAVILGILLARELGYFAGTVAGAIVVSGAYSRYFARRLGLSIARPRTRLRDLLRANPTFVEFALVSYVVAFVAPLSLLVVRATVLDHFGEAAAGLLQAAIGISLAINLLLNPLNGLLLTPRVNRTLPEREKHRETEAFQRKLLLAIAVVALPPCVFPDLAVLVLYSSRFIEAADSLYWFVMGQAMMQIQGIYTALMIGLDRLKAYGAVVVAGTAANAVLAVLLVPKLGLAGAGIAAFASACLLAVGTFVYLWAREGFVIGRVTALGTLVLFASLGLAGALVGTRSSLDVAALLAKSVVCVVAVALMVPVSLGRDERRALAGRLGAALRRG